MNFEDITVLIITHNEQPNIARCLQGITWAKQILVLDSGSTDETLDILRKDERVKVVHRDFDTFAEQCNFGVEQIETKWVLSLDADYILDEAFATELATLNPTAEGYRAAFTYCIHGKPLRSTLLPPRTVLYKRNKARYENDGHGHRVRVSGDVAELQSRIRHDDRKPLDRWLRSQLKYAAIEADKLSNTPTNDLGLPDNIRKKLIIAPWLVPLHCLIVQGLILDGLPGLHYALQRAFAELLLSLNLVERILLDRSSSTNA